MTEKKQPRKEGGVPHLQDYYKRGKGKRLEISLRDEKKVFIEEIASIRGTTQGNAVSRLISTHPLFQAWRQEPEGSEERIRLVQSLDI